MSQVTRSIPIISQFGKLSQEVYEITDDFYKWMWGRWWDLWVFSLLLIELVILLWVRQSLIWRNLCRPFTFENTPNVSHNRYLLTTVKRLQCLLWWNHKKSQESWTQCSNSLGQKLRLEVHRLSNWWHSWCLRMKVINKQCLLRTMKRQKMYIQEMINLSC